MNSSAGRASRSSSAKRRDSPLVDGTFAVECRSRVDRDGLDRFRRMQWVLHDRELETGEISTREHKIVGIESATPQPWWAKSADEVAREAVELAPTNDPLLGFTACVRARAGAGDEARGAASD